MAARRAVWDLALALGASHTPGVGVAFEVLVPGLVNPARPASAPALATPLLTVPTLAAPLPAVPVGPDSGRPPPVFFLTAASAAAVTTTTPVVTIPSAAGPDPDGSPLLAAAGRFEPTVPPEAAGLRAWESVLFAALVLLLAPGGAGSAAIADSDNPLVDALESPLAYDGETAVSQFVNAAGLAGLIASFFSIVYGYSRQTFALSRAGYLPKVLSVTGSRHVPALSLIVPGLIGLALAVILEDGALLINMAVFGATVSYVLMMLSHIVLRRREPGLERPYRTPGGTFTSGLALVLAVAAVIATFLVDEKAALIMLGVYAAFIAYFLLYSRHQIVARAPEEEFAALQAAEAELR